MGYMLNCPECGRAWVEPEKPRLGCTVRCDGCGESWIPVQGFQTTRVVESEGLTIDAAFKLRDRHDLTSAERKQMPAHRGFLKYFPDAVLCAAMLSMRADRKHTPDADPNDMSRPQWAKGKSADHGDCLVRHQSDVGTMDPELGLDYMIHVFWRAGAQLQEHIETHGIDSVIDWDWEPPFK